MITSITHISSLVQCRRPFNLGRLGRTSAEPAINDFSTRIGSVADSSREKKGILSGLCAEGLSLWYTAVEIGSVSFKLSFNCRIQNKEQDIESLIRSVVHSPYTVGLISCRSRPRQPFKSQDPAAHRNRFESPFERWTYEHSSPERVSTSIHSLTSTSHAWS